MRTPNRSSLEKPARRKEDGEFVENVSFPKNSNPKQMQANQSKPIPELCICFDNCHVSTSQLNAATRNPSVREMHKISNE